MEFTRLTPTDLKITVNQIDIVIGPNVSTGDVQLVTKSIVDTATEKNVRSFYGPGEYEAQGVMIDGVSAGSDDISYQLINEGIAIAALSIENLAALSDEVVDHLQPAHILCIWLETGSAQDFTALMGRFESSVIIPIKLPLEIPEIEKELQLKSEALQKVKLGSKDIGTDVRRLISLEA